VSQSDAVVQVQRVLQQQFPLLEVDGVWGAQTLAAFNNASSETRVRAITAAADAGYALQDLAKRKFVEATRSGQAARREREQQLPVQGDMVELVRRVALREDVPLETALRICWLESKFIPTAVSPTGAKGLFQFTSIATKDVLQRGGFDLRGKEFDAESNAIAGMRYIKLVAKDLGVSLTDTAKVYMGFNIGPTAARMYQRGQVTDTVKRLIGQQAYGPPEVYGTRLAAAVATARTA